MTEKELNIIKEHYNELIQLGRRSLEASQWIPAMRRVFKWLGLDFNTDNNGFLTYLGNGPESPKDNYTLVCEKLSTIESLLQATHDKPALDAYLAGYKQAIKDTSTPIERTAYGIERKEEEENE